MRISLRLGRVATILFFITAGLSPALAQPPQGEDLQALIVLLAPKSTGAPSSKEVVEAVNEDGGSGTRVIPGGLNEGNPYRARLVVSRRATGRLLEQINQDPSHPVARLERRVVLFFRPQVDIEAIAQALSQNQFVEFVERERLMRLHASSASSTKARASTSKAIPPLDPLVGTGESAPEVGQWGLHLMDVIEAWELGGLGTATLGILDAGVQLDHPELAWLGNQADEDILGPLRLQHSSDVVSRDCNIEELEENPDQGFAGHGTFTSGVATSAVNGSGSSGVCPGCDLHMIRVVDEAFASQRAAADGLDQLVSDGVQVVNMSFGYPGEEPCQEEDELRVLCGAIEDAAARDIVIVASAGNGRANVVDFPGNSVIAVGGVEWTGVAPDKKPTAAFWDDSPNCPDPEGMDCGANYGEHLDLVGPARRVIASMYEGKDHNPTIGCGDETLPDDPGQGYCSGTSLAAPQVAAIVGLVRSANPLLNREDVYDILTTTSSQAGNWTPRLAFGYPNAVEAIRRTLGEVRGQTLANRLVPLFSFFGRSANPDPLGNPNFRLAETHVYTTVPTMASSLLLVSQDPFDTIGPPVPEYTQFPGVNCQISPCKVVIPSASIYVFTTDREPFPGAPPLVPLYQVRYDPDIFAKCDPNIDIVPQRDFAYTTSVEGIRFFNTEATDSEGFSYDLDTKVGFLFQSCNGQPGCTLPLGTVPVYRMYNAERDDHAIFPQSELAAMEAEGYEVPSGFEPILGYAYPNVDSDGDLLIDGWETLLGTDPTRTDSDCDGLSDGDEVLWYDRILHRYGDPLDGPCVPFFFDGFESGDLALWSAAEP